jgi:hypothetical protein
MGDQRASAAKASDSGSATRITAPRLVAPTHLQIAGNRAIGRMLASHAIQAKMVVAPAGDRFESEADRVADFVVSMPAGMATAAPGISKVPVAPVQRKCTDCEDEEAIQRKCAQCEQEEEMQRKSAGGSSPAALVHSSIESSIGAARGAGQPLSAEQRSHFEPRFGRDLSGVRLHTDPHAAELSAAVGAHAFTTRQDIFFGAGRYQPHSVEGRRLIAHEITHTVQQSDQDVTLQREESKEAPAPDVDLDWKDDLIIEAFAGPARILGSSVYALMKAMATGFVKQVKADAKAKGGAFLQKVKDQLSLSGIASFVGHYWWGLVKGIFSPITGLIDLVVLGVKLQELQMHILATAWARRNELSADAAGLGQSMSNLGGQVKTYLGSLAQHPKDTVKALASWFSSLGDRAIIEAESGGRKAGKELMAQLDKPLPELGETAGEIVGTVLVNIVLLVFTEGLGNAITQIASKIGELGSFLGKFGKIAETLGVVVTKIGEALGTIGNWVAKAEAAIAKVAETVLKPIEPILKEFGNLIGKFRTFLRDLLGVAEESVGSATEQAAGGVAKTLDHAPPPAPKPPVKPPDPPPISKPTVKPALKPVVKPAPPAGAADEAASAATKAAPKDVAPPVTPKPGAPGGKLFEGISEETEAMMARRPGLRKALSEHPNAADLFKLCKSECFPGFMTDDEILSRLIRLERMEAQAAKAGVPFDRGKVKELLHAQKTVEDVDKALSAMQDRLTKQIHPHAEALSPSDPDVLNVPDPAQTSALAEPHASPTSPREVWEPPKGAPKKPPLNAPKDVRRKWLRDRLQMHVDAAISRYEAQGLTAGQEAAVSKGGQAAMFRGSRIDQFAKDSIMQDPELAEIITSSDFFAEPDVFDSVLPEWFDVTTRRQWAAHLRKYAQRYGAGHLLPTN